MKRAGSAKEEVHLSDRLRGMTVRLCGPIELQTFCLGRFRVSGGFSLRGGGAGTGLIRVGPLWHRCLGYFRGDCLKGFGGGLISTFWYRNSTVEDMSLRGCGEDSVGGKGGGLRRFAMVWGEFGLIARLLFGFVLERQQVGLLLLQALMESLCLALLLELPPLELLSQSVGLIQGGEKRRRSWQPASAWQS